MMTKSKKRAEKKVTTKPSENGAPKKAEAKKEVLPDLEKAVDDLDKVIAATKTSVMAGEGEVDLKLKENVEGHKAADDVLDLIKTELGDQANTRFWEILRDVAIQKIGMPIEHSDVAPLDDKKAALLLKRIIPRGKYAGKTVKHVLDRDPNYLKQFCNSPDFFQKRLRRYFARSEERLVGTKAGEKQGSE